VLLIIGVLLLLRELGVLPGNWFSFWATVCFVVGGLKLFQSENWVGRLWGVFLLWMGGVIELGHLGYERVRFERIWPVFLIAAGVMLIIRAFEGPPGARGVVSGHLNLFNVMGGGEYRIQAKNFRGGRVTAIMGGFDIDLRDADMEGSEAMIDLTAFLGGGVIRIPETWGAVIRGSSFMGGYSLKVREGSAPQKTLYVDGIAMLGGVEVRN
jgi:predicted membrane protein